jgi:hypothetical protein
VQLLQHTDYMDPISQRKQNKMSSTEIAIRETFAPVSADLAQQWAEEMDGEEVEFQTVRTPTAGGTTWEIEDEDPTKELQGIVLDAYEAHVLYLGEYDGEGRPPAGYWIAKELQYLSDEAKAAGFTADSWQDRDRVSNRLVLFLARPGTIVPIKIDLTGASVRPWRLFKQNQIVNKGQRVTAAALGLSLESRKYSSGFSGSVLEPKLLGWLPEEQAAAYKQQADELRPFTRATRTPSVDSEAVVEAPVADLAAEFAANGIGDAPEVV